MSNSSESPTLKSLDAKSLEVFAKKGQEGGAAIAQTGNSNAAKVRRVLQVTQDLATRPLEQLRILDVACGDGVYGIEAAVHGAEVVAFDARTERMEHGMHCAKVNGLDRITFEQQDLRRVCRDSHGEFDVIYILGILYHLDVPDVFSILESMYGMCRQFMIIDTHVGRIESTIEHNGHVYGGKRSREHQDQDSQETRRSKQLMSIDNTFNFTFTGESLIRLLQDMGFTSVFECLAPPEPDKPNHRRTYVAHKGSSVTLSTYPWINDLTEEEIAERLQPAPTKPKSFRQRLRRRLDASLKRRGFEIRHL